MKIIISMITIFALVVTSGITFSEAAESSKLYTAHNIWRMIWYNMKCINYKHGSDILPAGTMVKNVGTGSDSHLNKPYITFKTVNDNRVYKIFFVKRWHSKKSMKDYIDMMFTTKNFGAQTEGLSEMEIEAIKKGVLVNGMSKRAVFICYGCPPDHYTPQLTADVWFYWMNEKDKVEIKFDQDGRLDLIGSKAAQAAEKTDESIIQSGSASGAQVAAIPGVNKLEPWTGIWKVEGHRQFIGPWGMKQRGKTVISTKDSLYNFKGEVKGNQLKGRMLHQDNSYPFVIEISSDGQSFEGKVSGWANRTYFLKGKRKE